MPPFMAHFSRSGTQTCKDCDSFLRRRKGATLALGNRAKRGHGFKVVHAQPGLLLPFYLFSQDGSKVDLDLRRSPGAVLRISGVRWRIRLPYSTFLSRNCPFSHLENRVEKQLFLTSARCPKFGQPHSPSIPLHAMCQNRVLFCAHFSSQNHESIEVYCKKYFQLS